MAAVPPIELDGTDARLLAALSPATAVTPRCGAPEPGAWAQQDGRQSIAELGRRVSMSASAVAERVRRPEDAGVITGYRAVVDPERLGRGILAHLRLRYPSSTYGPLHALLAETPEVIEAHHVTGDDCFVLKVIATSMRHLERISDRIGTLGSVTTSIAYSSPVRPRAITPAG